MSVPTGERAVKLAQDLVRLPSEAPPGAEKAVAERLAEVLSAAGLEVQLVEAAPDRPNVVARLRGEVPGPTLLYQGHIDVVPAGDHSLWHFPPYAGVIQDGKLYGRGAADMKGGVAAMTAAALKLKEERMPLKGDLVLAFVVDEEVTNRGAKKLVADGLKADWAVIGEPTNLEIALGHRGVVAFKVRTSGRAVHAAQGQSGVNAIEKAFSFAREIFDFGQTLAERNHPLLGSASLHLTTIIGGTKVNIIPDTCEMMLDRRLLPGETKERAEAEIAGIIERLSARDKDFRATLAVTTYCPPGEIPAGHPLVQALRDATQKVLGMPAQHKGFEATCEASIITNGLGTPAVIFGPGRIAQAHNADEYVEVDQIMAAADIYTELARSVLGPGAEGGSLCNG